MSDYSEIIYGHTGDSHTKTYAKWIAFEAIARVRPVKRVKVMFTDGRERVYEAKEGEQIRTIPLESFRQSIVGVEFWK